MIYEFHKSDVIEFWLDEPEQPESDLVIRIPKEFRKHLMAALKAKTSRGPIILSVEDSLVTINGSNIFHEYYIPYIIKAKVCVK